MRREGIFQAFFASEEERIVRGDVESGSGMAQAFHGRGSARLPVFWGRKGYFFGGVLPQWFWAGTGLLMQKTISRPNWEDIHVFSERAKKILEFVQTDWRQSQG